MHFFDKTAIGTRLDRTAVVYLILYFLFLSPVSLFAQQIDACLDRSSPCHILTSTTPQLSEPDSGQQIAPTNTDRNIASLVGEDNLTVSFITDLLAPYTAGNADAASTSNAIAETCLNKSNNQRLQKDCHALVNAALQGDSHTTSALLQIAPRFATKANKIARAGSLVQLKNLQSRIDAIRKGNQGFSLQGFDLHIYDQKLPIGQITTAYQKQQIKRSALSAEQLSMDSSFGMFFTGDIITSRTSMADSDASLDFDTNGITLGADYRLTERLILGSAFGYVDTNKSLLNGTGELDTRGYSLSLYGTYSGRTRYYLDFAASYGVNNIKQQRFISYQLAEAGAVSQEMTANYNSDKFSLFFGSGYDFRHNFWVFGPRVDLQYIQSTIDDFTERSSDAEALGSGWAARSSAINRHWLTWNLGGRLSYTQDMYWGSLEPYSRLDWLHEYKNHEQVLNAYFLYDSDGNAIPITTSDPDRDYLRLKIGTSAKFKRGMEAYFNYDTLFAHSGRTGQTIKIGFRMDL